MNFMLVFAGHGKPCLYNYAAADAGQAIAFGKEMSQRDPARWGEFLYARSPARQSLERDQFYKLSFNKASQRLSYRQEHEVVSGPFDYLEYCGPHRESIGFQLTWPDKETGGKTSLTAWFNAGRSFKFLDMCRDYLARFTFRDGKPFVEFHQTFFSGAHISIPLELACA